LEQRPRQASRRFAQHQHDECGLRRRPEDPARREDSDAGALPCFEPRSPSQLLPAFELSHSPLELLSPPQDSHLYLGTHPAKFEWKGESYDQLLKPGDTQRFYFTEDDPPPFYDLDAPKEDTPTTKTNRKGALGISSLPHPVAHSYTPCGPVCVSRLVTRTAHPAKLPQSMPLPPPALLLVS
jgi:hypothetical protein